MRTFVLFLATGAYSGYTPVAPGTVGSLIAIPLVFLSDWFFGVSLILYLMILIAVVSGACWIAGAAEHYLGEHDSGKIVIDEIAGFLCATAFMEITVSRLILAFFLFRLFDILKPPPARYFDQKVPGGFGIVLDDLSAGLYANLLVRVFL